MSPANFLPILSLALLLVSTSAAAATNPCGNIELTAIGSCKIETSGGCKAQCEPLSLVASCDGQCNLSVDTKCSGTCQADCEAKCNVDPPKFNCQAQCTSDCRARIAVRCESEQDKAGCQSYCDAMCDTDCRTQCDPVAAMADCKGKCQGSCSGSCETDANFSCSYTQCSAQLKGGCQASCDAPEGALFCDGQFINVSDLAACAEYLATNFKVSVDLKASASAKADGTGASCAVSGGPASSLGWLAAALGLLALGGRRKKAARDATPG